MITINLTQRSRVKRFIYVFRGIYGLSRSWRHSKLESFKQALKHGVSAFRL